MSAPGSQKAPTDRRKAAERRGRRAEWLATAAMMLCGFQLLCRRFKTKGGEIDLIAKRGKLVVFAEVKARPTVDAALEAVTWRARRRIESAGKAYIAKNPQFARADLRYDIIAVTGWRVRRITDAWREGD